MPSVTGGIRPYAPRHNDNGRAKGFTVLGLLVSYPARWSSPRRPTNNDDDDGHSLPTIKKGRFDDTNQMFVNPKNFDFHVTTQDAKKWAPKIVEEIKK